MLPRAYRLPSFAFRKLKKFGQSIPSKLLVVSYLSRPAHVNSPKTRNGPAFGFIVGKILSKKATQRNLIKRRLSEAVWVFIQRHPEKILGLNEDFCLIARRPILEADYEELSSEVNQILSKIIKF